MGSRHVCGIAEPFLQEKQNLKLKVRQTLSVDSLSFVMKVKNNRFYIEIDSRVTFPKQQHFHTPRICTKIKNYSSD